MTRLVFLLLLALAPPLAAQTTTTTTLPPCDPSLVAVQVEPSGLRYWLKRQCNWHEEMRHNVLVLNDRVLLGPFTVAELQALDPSENANRVATVRDAAVAGSCTSGGGTSRALCQSSGTAWVPLGNGATGGDGAASYLVFSSCGVVDGTVPVSLGPSACADQAEARAVGRVKNAATMGQLACVLSATTGSRTMTITARSGACGGALVDSSVVCTIGAGQAECDSGAATLAVAAGHCVSLRVATSGALPGDRVLTCLMERIS